MKVLLLIPPSSYTGNVARDFFYGCWCKGKRIASAEFPPTTYLTLFALLKKEGYNTHMLDCQAEKLDKKQAIRKIKQINPQIIIITTATMAFNEDMDFFCKYKKDNNVITVAFGSHTTFFPRLSVDNNNLDFSIQGEPELIIKDLLRAINNKSDLKKIKGIAYKKDKKIIINSPSEQITDLDDLPFPDRSYIKQFEYYNPLVKKIPWTTSITSRGCPGLCNFCTSPSFYGKKIRARSAKKVFEEMKQIKKDEYKEVFFRDEMFTSDKKRLIDLCNMLIKSKINLSWICSARIGSINKEDIKLMKKAGCHMIRFGVESGNQTILNNIKKYVKIDVIRKTFKWTKQIGMETHAHFMLGCIGETKKTINDTIRFAKEIDPTTVTFAIFTPYPGTQVFEIVKKSLPEIKDGSQIDLSKVHDEGVYNHIFCDLSNKELKYAIKKAYQSFYLRPSYLFKTLIRIRSLDELRRVVLAGMDVISYALEK